MKKNSNPLRIGIAAAVIVGTIVWLAWSGYGANKSYYVTIPEFESHSPKAASGRTMRVNYKGSEPPPDTFKDDSQAVAEGTYGRDGEFHATVLQAKCASKYAPAGSTEKPGMAAPGKPAAAPAAAANTAAKSPTAPSAN